MNCRAINAVTLEDMICLPCIQATTYFCYSKIIYIVTIVCRDTIAVTKFILKATSHSTIFDIPMRPLREDQKHRDRFTHQRRPATPVMVIIPLNFARCTLPTHGNR